MSAQKAPITLFNRRKRSSMKTSTLLTAFIGIMVLLGGGYFLLQGGDNKEDTHNAGMNQQQSTASSEEPAFENLKGANIGETVDATGQAEVTVSIDDFIFNTTVLTIDKGTKVTWVNDGNVRHDVTTANSSEIQDVNSELLANGESFSHTFEESGRYDYFCSPHPTQMRGVIVVK
jgi:plastocyanin